MKEMTLKEKDCNICTTRTNFYKPTLDDKLEHGRENLCRIGDIKEICEKMETENNIGS